MLDTETVLYFHCGLIWWFLFMYCQNFGDIVISIVIITIIKKKKKVAYFFANGL